MEQKTELFKKVNLLAKFFADESKIGDDDIDRLDELHEIYKSIYQENRIPKGFSEARIMSYMAVINEVLHPYEPKRLSDYKAKYEKCIDVIKRFDPGIIGMYDL